MSSQVQTYLKQAEELISKNKPGEAAELLKKCLKEDPENINTQILIAKIMMLSGDFDRSIRSINFAISKKPDDAKLYVIAAQIFRHFGRIGQIKPYIDKALQLEPENYDLNFMLCNLYSDQRDYKRSVEHGLRAIKANPKDPGAYEALGIIYEIQGNIDELKKLIADFRKNVSATEPLYIESKLFAREDKYIDAIEVLEKILDSQSKQRLVEGALRMDLGNYYDKAGNFEKAFENIKLGNLQFREKYKDHSSNDLAAAIFNSNREYFSREENYKNIPVHKNISGRKAPVFILSFPRSGTTLLEQALFACGKFFLTDEADYVVGLHNATRYIEKSFNYPQGLATLAQEDVGRLEKAYFDMVAKDFGQASIEQRICDKGPINSHYLPMIKAVFPDAKIIFILRDPRAVTLSCFFQNFRHSDTLKNFYTLEDTVDFYDRTMELYLKYKSYLGADILEVRYEDIVDDFESKMRQVYNFIGEEWTDEVLKFNTKKRDKANFTPNYVAITKPVYKGSKDKWRNYEDKLTPYLPKLEKYIKAFGY
jgi:tetratricopeptide (TPR) repeat protein